MPPAPAAVGGRPVSCSEQAKTGSPAEAGILRSQAEDLNLRPSVPQTDNTTLAELAALPTPEAQEISQSILSSN